jgi:AcrR family transcriptional regulator
VARINLERRAEIGQEKRARTRTQLVWAARALFSTRSLASVTIDDLVREAGVAKGTFYTHFDDMHALAAAVADDLIASFDELIQPLRTAAGDPLLRVALGCDAFIGKALQDPAWGSLVARMAQDDPTIGETARARLREDLSEALKESPRPGFSVDLAVEAVAGILLQVLTAIGAGRLSHEDRAGAVGAMLGALGVGKRKAASIVAKLEHMRATHLRLEDESWGAPGGGGNRAPKA